MYAIYLHLYQWLTLCTPARRELDWGRENLKKRFPMMRALCLILVALACASASPSFARNMGGSSGSDCWTCKKIVTVARSLSGSFEERLDHVCDHVFSWMKPKVSTARGAHFFYLFPFLSLAQASLCYSASPSWTATLMPFWIRPMTLCPLLRCARASARLLARLRNSFRPLLIWTSTASL